MEFDISAKCNDCEAEIIYTLETDSVNDKQQFLNLLSNHECEAETEDEEAEAISS